MAKKKSAKRRKSTPASISASKDSLEGLRDALDLTLTRVIEDDMGVEEARAVLRYLEKELDGFEKRTSPAKSPARKVRQRTTATRKSRRTRE